MPITSTFLRQKLADLRKKHPHAGQFCFFTDTENLPAIFKAGKLLCRSGVQKQNLLRRDCASQEVLQATPAWVHDYVRLYFAPLTPMLYRVEGIKRTPDQWPECPRPVYIGFDPGILTVKGIRVSNGNMASKGTICQEATDAFFDQLPFDHIFHRSVVPKYSAAESALGVDPDARQLGSRRHAEVLIPRELSLGFARRLVFRSEAERDLAQRDVHRIPTHLKVELKSDWFFANRRRRPYLKSFSFERDGTFEVENALRGDQVVRVEQSRPHGLRAWIKTYDGSSWTAWKTADQADLAVPTPRLGRRAYYLLGHRVAEEDV